MLVKNSTDLQDLVLDYLCYHFSVIGLSLSVFGTPKDIIIGIIYRPPNTDPVAFNESFQEILTKIDRENRICYLLGDFNLDLFKADHHGPTSDFLNSLFSHSHWPLITRPTRVEGSSSTLIDNIITNNIERKPQFLNGILLNDISDHYPVFHICKTISSTDHDKPLIRRLFNASNERKFVDMIKEEDWDSLIVDDTEQSCKSFINTFGEFFITAFPKTIIRTKYKNR